jgi:hypothetical protein
LQLKFPHQGIHHRLPVAGGGGEMEIAIVAGLFTEGNMDVDTGHGRAKREKGQN